MLLMDDLQNNTEPRTPTKFASPPTPRMDFEHYAMPMVHLTMGKTISSYKQLMSNPVTPTPGKQHLERISEVCAKETTKQEWKAQMLCS